MILVYFYLPFFFFCYLFTFFLPYTRKLQYVIRYYIHSLFPQEFMIQEVLNETGLEVVVLVKDLNHHMTATLSSKAFMQKLQVLRDMVQVRTRKEKQIHRQI